MDSDSLATLSLVAVYSAIAVYVLAFIAFVLDLSARSAQAQRLESERAVRAADAVGADARSGQLAKAGAAVRGAAASATATTAAVLDRASAAGRGRVSDADDDEVNIGSRWQRTGLALTVIAWLIHIAAIVMRGLAAGRVPWANMFEFAMTGTGVVVTVFLAVQLWRDLRFLGAYVTGIVALLLGLATVNFYVAVTPLPPPLQSAWLVIHVFVATLGTGFFAVGAGLSLLQLMQVKREEGGAKRIGFLRTLPSSEALESMAYRVIVVGFAFWTFTLIAGAIWAERAWGRYWGWDTKEVWTFVIWVVFAGYIHARATKGWRGSRAAYLAIIGFAAVLFNFTIVNLFFKGLHSYSGLDTGM
ncbi:c-type cytochrome biogenesis protein CcsB [Schumannella luteola]|uniref:Cytochrome c-type biogenesis protein CcsB n=1 Tax=Schumannella luteola TaxID=472059 RepID=A0A852Y8L8_9MICO|nr:cytochrome c-type biogenesis protein CcsB [Schumannella luteola]TPX01580.1 c-type cytochrome biogenesis protein CcsB [Schumannella luteola]